MVVNAMPNHEPWYGELALSILYYSDVNRLIGMENISNNPKRLFFVDFEKLVIFKYNNY